ncbi:MAG: ParA family protein [Planctomycetes bacterium]|nr:ParA family protein [Planctomycetota bacterium]NOG55361.1 ParA family protein [Planctomycetota bacterium]
MPNMTRTIAFLNQKGGVGKTTTVANVAAAMAAAGRSVGVIDLDPQAHLTLHLGIEPDGNNAPEQSVYDVLTEQPSSDGFATVADSTWIEAAPNLMVMPSEVDLAAVEVELADQPGRTRRLADALRHSEIAQCFDFLLLDCPPSLGLLTVNALAAAREVIVPMQAHFLALQGVARLLKTVGMVFEQVNPKLQVTGVVLCMFEGQTRLAAEVVENLETFFAGEREKEVPWRNCRVFKPPIRRNIKLAEAPSFGQSILEYDASCPGAQDYTDLAQTLMRQWDKFVSARNGMPATEQPLVTQPDEPSAEEESEPEVVVRHMAPPDDGVEPAVTVEQDVAATSEADHS